jgi:hypothetical protein
VTGAVWFTLRFAESQTAAGKIQCGRVNSVFDDLYENPRYGQYFFQMQEISFAYGAFPSVLRT